MSHHDDRVPGTGSTARLVLEPLRAEHAAEMVAVLAGRELYEHIGGTAPTLQELRERYDRLVAGSPDPSERWCNWILRVRDDGQAVGYAQATLGPGEDAAVEAHVAWVVGVPWQRRGYATEAGRWLLGEVRRSGARRVVARIGPTNAASAAVARRLGLDAGALVAGEREWATRCG